MEKSSKIIVALDFPSSKIALNFVQQLSPKLCKLKVGKELFTSEGSKLIEKLVSLNYDVFLDLKYHDIPNTVAKACKVAANMGVWMLNVHAMGGREMMLSAKKSIASCNHQPLIIAVTLLTSHSQETLKQIGLQGSIESNVLNLAQLSYNSGMDGVVCSAQEAAMLRKKLNQPFKLITPGIRHKSSQKDDQNRIVTPEKALLSGSDYLVIGRPITQAKKPLIALQEISSKMDKVQLSINQQNQF